MPMPHIPYTISLASPGHSQNNVPELTLYGKDHSSRCLQHARLERGVNDQQLVDAEEVRRVHSARLVCCLAPAAAQHPLRA